MYSQKAFNPYFNLEYEPRNDISNYSRNCFCHDCNHKHILEPFVITHGHSYTPYKNESFVRWSAIHTNISFAKNLDMMVNKKFISNPKELDNNSLLVSEDWFIAYNLFLSKRGTYRQHTLRDFYRFLHYG